MKLRTRLFILVGVGILATLFVGLTGVIGMRYAVQSINEIGGVRLPSVEGLEIVNEGQTAIKAANLTTAIYENNNLAQAQFADVVSLRKKIWARIDKGWKQYEVLPQTPEEEQLWKQFVAEWKAWQAADQKIDEIIVALSKNASEEEQKKLFVDFYRQYQASEPLFAASEAALAKVVDLNTDVAGAAASDGQTTASRSSLAMLIAGAIAILSMAVFGMLSVRAILGQIGGEPAYAAAIADRIAAGDLTTEVSLKPGDQSSMLFAMKRMRDSLAKIAADVRAGVDTISAASSQIASGNLDLSSRTEAQASSLEQTASSMEQLTSTVKQNADNARQANSQAMTASDIASKGGAVVSEVVTTMGAINESARKIVDIISVIDGIAFQTNILALNAAVEAARAGEQGRGFAVVASEVRTLAQRSAGAAKEIKTLIDDSVQKVASGSRLVDQAGATMVEVVESVKRVSDLISEITSASQEQTDGIEQINQAVTQMDEVTQQNAALVEEAAAAAKSLQDQAENLAQAVSVFKLNLDQNASRNAARLAAPEPQAAMPALAAQRVPVLVEPARKLVALKKTSGGGPLAAKGRSGTTDEWEEF